MNNKKDTENSRLVISLPKNVCDEFTRLAKENGMSRTSMINYALKWYLDYKSSADNMARIIELFQSNPEILKNQLENDKKKE